jgi:hypothetical protein
MRSLGLPLLAQFGVADCYLATIQIISIEFVQLKPETTSVVHMIGIGHIQNTDMQIAAF